MDECRHCGATLKRPGNFCGKQACKNAKMMVRYYEHTQHLKPNDCTKCGKPLYSRNRTYRMHIECRTTTDRVSGSCLGCGASIRVDTCTTYCCIKCISLARKLAKLMRSLDTCSK